MWRATYLLAIFTLVQIFIGLVALFYIRKTLVETGEVLIEARKTTKAANEATDAAVRTAEAAENAERAYVFPVADVKFCGEVSEGVLGDEKKIAKRQKIRIQLKLANIGKTPAMEVNCRLAMQDGDDDTPEYLTEQDALADYYGPGGNGSLLYRDVSKNCTIGAGEELDIGEPFFMPTIRDDGCDQIANTIIFYMIYESSDIFDKRGSREKTWRLSFHLEDRNTDTGEAADQILLRSMGVVRKDFKDITEDQTSKKR